MEAENEEEGYTLTSFEPLEPEDEKSGLRKFIEGFKSRKFVTLVAPKATSHDSQTSLESSTQNRTQVSYLNSDVKRKEQLPKESPVTQGLSSKVNRQLQDPSQGKTVASLRSRTPSSVLRRLSQLVLLEKSNPQQSQGTNNLKKYWMPDEQCKVCYECGVKFHTFRRRHHCRLCGQIFCSRCCNEVVSGHQIGYTGVFRVCIYCKKIVLTYTSSSDIEKNLKQLKEDLSLVAQPDSTNPTVSVHGWNASLDDPELNRSFDVFGVSAEEANLLKQDSFKDLWKQITTPRTGLEFLTHRVRLRTYSTCFVGRDLMNWLMINRKAPNRPVALQICQGLQDLGWIEPLSTKEPAFKDDFFLYIPGPRASGELYYPDLRSPSSVSQGNDSYKGKREPVSWLSASFDQSVAESRREGFHKSNSTSTIVNQDLLTSPSRVRSLSCENIVVKVDSTCKEDPPCKDQENTSECPSAQSPRLDVFVNVEDCYLPRRLVSVEASEETGAENDVTGETKKDDTVTAKDLVISSSEENEERVAFEKLRAIHDKHISAFLVQLLDRVGLSQSWKDVIEPLAIKVCQTVMPNVENDDEMDIRHYVKIKKISGGLRSDCRIVSGVVCTKNVVHKKMAPIITQPLILMLACPVDFQRVENKMASLDSLVLQEEEFLKNMVGRIVALQPRLVLVEKTVSRLAQDMLLARGISVILNIKPKLMARISRCVQGDVLLSLDQGSRPKLGTCQKFKIEKFVFKNGSTKTLSFFEGCNPQLGATILLRGGNRKELAVVRDVLRFMVFVAYNSKLEKAFIMDEFGTPFVQETQGEDDEIMGDNVSRQNSKVEFSVEGETASDEQNIDNTETRSEKEGHFTLKDNCGSSAEANGVCLEGNFEVNGQKSCTEANKSELPTKDIDLTSDSYDIENVHTNISTDNKTCDSLPNVVNSESFQHILDNIVLSSSPLVKYPLPYLLTSEGKQCELHEFMTGDIYWSPLFFGECSADRSSSEDEVNNSQDKSHENVFIKETHPFVLAVLEKDAWDLKALELLASYRAEGGRITLRKQNGNLCALNGFDGLDGIKGDLTVQGRIYGDTFVPTNRAERAGSDQYREKLLRDCFDPFLHQMIAVMFSSYSMESGNFPRPCITPWTVFMEFYARNDITLGCFLERYCFRSSYVCPNPNCDVPMVKHVRYFAHGDGAVYINMKNLESPIPGFSQTLLTWSWCKLCKQVTPVVQVSAEAWRLSFAKYLELRIYASCYRRRATVEPCDHSLHQDHYQYFALNNIVASLKYVPLNIYSVHFPPSTITIIEEERKPQFWIKHIQAMSVRVYQLINLISDRIAALKTEAYISNCVTDIAYARGQLDEKIKVLDSKAMLLLSPPTSPGETQKNRLLEPHEVSAVEYEILDGITLLKRMMCEYGEKWNAKLVELLQLENEKKKFKSMEGKNSSSTQTSSQSPMETSQMTDDSVFSNSTATQLLESSRSFTQINPFAIENIPSSPENNQSTPGNNQSTPGNNQTSDDNPKTSQDAREVSPGFSDSNTTERSTLDDDVNSSFESEAKVEMSIGQRGFSNSSSQKFQKHSKLWATLTEEVSSTLKDVQYVEDRPGPKMKRIISQFLPGVSFRSIPSPFPVHEHHLLPVSEEIPIVVNEREPTSIIAYTLSSPDYLKRLHKIQESMEEDSEPFTCIDAETDGVSLPSDGVRSRTRTRSEAETMSSTSLMNTLDDEFVENYFQWSELDEEDTDIKDTTGKPEVNNPEVNNPEVNNPEHLGDSEGNEVQDGARIAKVKIEEPAHARRDAVSKVEDNLKKSEVDSGSSKETEVSLNDGVKSAEDSIMDGKESLPNSSSSTQEDVEYHIKHAFSDSSAKFFCIVYFGEQFRRIRKAVFLDGEEKYIRSLQYCLKWQATGGKSGSSFCKTTDDRFVIKEMSRLEAQSFLNIAPYYFQYIEKAIEEKRPTLLVKILGVYRIGCNSKLTNTPVKKDLLVMDNLFYNCKVSQIFDLKGSIRSRYVYMSSEKEGDVLLDENLLEMIAESPLFIRPHSKAVLSRGINNDTEFLAKHMVMDYSLLLGIEQNSCKLIVGIIDYIRTFTWDKKLEMYVKSTGILGGQGKMPTVVSPELYRERFCEAMQRYFLMIPNKWMGLGNELK